VSADLKPMTQVQDDDWRCVMPVMLMLLAVSFRKSPGLFSYIVTPQLLTQVVLCLLSSANAVGVCVVRDVVSVAVCPQ
jgi:hypothetical protein